MKHTLESYTAAVNALAKRDADRLNAKHRAGKLLFAASCPTISKESLAHAFASGLSPREAHKALAASAY